MKKLLLLILTMVMLFTFVACGGGNNDENNAAMQAKIDEAETLLQEITNWYKDNGFLEGDSAAQIQPVVDKLITQLDEIKASHQEILDAGGYEDEQAATMAQGLDALIAKYKEGKEKLKTFKESAEAGTGIEALTVKYNEVVDLVNQASKTGKENGWENDEDFKIDLGIAFTLLADMRSKMENPSEMDEAYMNDNFAILAEMIPLWQDYLTKVSEPYAEN